MGINKLLYTKKNDGIRLSAAEEKFGFPDTSKVIKSKSAASDIKKLVKKPKTLADFLEEEFKKL